MPHRTTPVALLALALAAAGCASGASASEDAGLPSDASAPVLEGPGIRAGWMSLKAPTKPNQITTLSLIAESTREGKLMAAGASMPGGKVISDKDAATLVSSFEFAGFDKYAVQCGPADGPPGALAVVWLDRGDGIRSLFLVPGARQNPATEDLPDVYAGIKQLVFYLHQATPGSAVRVGKGWSGEDMLNQKPGEIRR